jgi:hypothetical protein
VQQCKWQVCSHPLRPHEQATPDRAYPEAAITNADGKMLTDPRIWSIQESLRCPYIPYSLTDSRARALEYARNPVVGCSLQARQHESRPRARGCAGCQRTCERGTPSSAPVQARHRRGIWIARARPPLRPDYLGRLVTAAPPTLVLLGRLATAPSPSRFGRRHDQSKQAAPSACQSQHHLHDHLPRERREYPPKRQAAREKLRDHDARPEAGERPEAAHGPELPKVDEVGCDCGSA